jgi:O-antigen/teichoic acid export membrane protein
MSDAETQKSTIYQRAVQGGVWLFSLRYFGRALDLVRAVVLARLLLPRDFGQMAIALLSVSILDTFTQVGVGEALIQRKEDIHDYLDTAWTMGILRGVLVFLVLLFVAPWITLFFDGSGEIRTDEVDADQIALQIRQHPTMADGYLLGLFSEAVRGGLGSYDPEKGFSAALKELLIGDLNKIIQTQRLWEHPAFVEISARRQKVLVQKIQEKDLMRANRLLLEELFAKSKGIQPTILDRTQVSRLIQVIGFIYCLGCLANIGIVYFNRDLQFARQFVFRSIGLLGGTAAALAVAFVYRSVWALALGRLMDTVLICLFSYVLHPYRPRWHLDWEKARSLWAYGRHILWSTILKFLVLQGDDLFLAKMLGFRTLGLYRYAYQFSSLVATEAGVLINKVAFPVFSRLQENLEKIKGGYEKSIRYVVFLAYPFSGGLIVLARETVLTILGPEWLEMVSAFQILCILGFCKGMQGGNVFMALGRPGIITRLYILRLILMVVSIYPLTRFMGMSGTALSVTASALLVMPVHLYFVQQCIGHTLWDYAKTVFAPLAATGIMMGLLIVLKSLIPWSGLPGLGVLAFSGVFLYGVSLYLLSRIFKEYALRELYLNIRKGWSG